MTTSYARSSFNPALKPSRGYVGIPGITNFSGGYRTNTFTLDRFLFPGLGSEGKTALFLNQNVSYNQFMRGISDLNYMDLDLNETLLGMGFYVGKNFFTFDASLRVHGDINVPRDVFSFLKRGVTFDGTDRTYNLSNLSVDAIAYGQIGAGAAIPLFDNHLVLGVKAKILLGIADGRAHVDRMNINIHNDEWSITDTRSTLQLGLRGLKPRYDSDGYFDGLNADDVSYFPANGSGWGLDFGATFRPGIFAGDKHPFFQRLTLSAAITDLGVIHWNRSTILSLTSEPITLTGNKEISFDDSEDIFSDFTQSMKELYNFHETPETLRDKTTLKARFNWGIDYAFPSKEIHVGLLSTTRFNARKAVTEYTLGASMQPIKEFEAGLSYSFSYAHFQSLGLSIHLGPIFFFSGDYLLPRINSYFVPVSAHAFNWQCGVVIPIGKKH
jgi:hypothetical protein